MIAGEDSRLRNSMNEAETRADHIDPALKAAGWGVVEGSRIRREYAISPGRIEGQGRRGNPLNPRLLQTP
jgi:type I restriction enzyme R subunit